MKAIIPLPISSDPSLSLPFHVFENDLLEVTFEEFSIEDRKEYFGLEMLEIDSPTGVKYRPQSNSLGLPRSWDGDHFFGAFLAGNVRLVIQSKSSVTDNLNTFFDFITGPTRCFLKLLFGVTTKYWKTFPTHSESSPFSGGVNSTLEDLRSCRTLSVTEDRLKRLKKLYEVSNQYPEEIERLSKLLTLGFSRGDFGVAGATLVTILEWLVLDDANQELSYKFKLWLSKIRGKDMDYFNRVGKLYGYRSKYFHQGESKFTKEDVAFLEQEVEEIATLFFTNGAMFEDEGLNRSLLE